MAYLLHEIPWIYGAQASPIHGDSYGSLPTLMHPNEVLDGALVSIRDYEGCSRDATYFYQNPSILSELYRRHGVDLDFVGVVLFTSGPDMDAKQLACEYAYKLLRMLDGVVVFVGAIGTAVVVPDPLTRLEELRVIGGDVLLGLRFFDIGVALVGHDSGVAASGDQL